VHIGHLALEERVDLFRRERQVDPATAREARDRLLDARADGRLGEFRPGDADVQLLEGAQLDALEPSACARRRRSRRPGS
jgi:hypothetical protein